MTKAREAYPYQICVSGSSKGGTVANAHALAEAAGRRIAESGNTLLTGATGGLPDYAAKGAKAAGGMSIGFSPASTRWAHVKSYRLPTKYYDSIVCTGFGYTGRDLLLARSSDAVVVVGGRIGTLHEFAVLIGTGGISDSIKGLLAAAKRVRHTVIYDADPVQLVDRLIAVLDERLDR